MSPLPWIHGHTFIFGPNTSQDSQSPQTLGWCHNQHLVTVNRFITIFFSYQGFSSHSYMFFGGIFISTLNIQLGMRDLGILKDSFHQEDSPHRNQQVSQRNYSDNNSPDVRENVLFRLYYFSSDSFSSLQNPWITSGPWIVDPHDKDWPCDMVHILALRPLWTLQFEGVDPEGKWTRFSAFLSNKFL